jgi:hypothetical protein
MKLNFLGGFSRDYSDIKFHAIRPIGAELLHTETRTNKTKLAVAFRNFATEPNKCQLRILQDVCSRVRNLKVAGRSTVSYKFTLTNYMEQSSLSS